MHTPQLRDLTETTPEAVSNDVAAAEPSHIHIPRPSRTREAGVVVVDDGAADLPPQLTFDEAA